MLSRNSQSQAFSLTEVASGEPQLWMKKFFEQRANAKRR